ncbi:AP-3 complex subunit delta [Pyricularia oryzae]|nr:AP-3 complex subunit delta [Pyricularia oryzae Y34]KAI7926867.1 AP-3 complex subunit delta [Pyricularia oryzae]KAI7928357.1 AP-3 complex subunit delta [Pyricularia oryzae]
MDLKATALLKLVYLEMMGHDMSWASFHVLEVMSSPKIHQKRLGYLGAVQTFRPDTEVLMLATNLLKKDLMATAPNTIGLPIITLPHIITPSLALSVLADLLPRLSHSHASIRKKTIVTLYRLALVYPETLRAAWPKIKDRLMDKDEDPSVTAAIVNVVCELGWRRPHDFLPLAPRLFELLVEGGNNWMAIKLIKLFATLTPLEPRLIRKLLPPLTDIIRTTPAMSLLYECINGIIQGGILGSPDDISGTEEIATLIVSKLRGMIMIDGDPNLKYVALLAFNKIVTTHPFLVAEQEDVILECIDSPDITIRIKALDLVQGMVSADNLESIVSRLMRQLKVASEGDRQPKQTQTDSDVEDDGLSNINTKSRATNSPPPLPEEYRIDVIGRIIHVCSLDNYNNLLDFDWYIDILTQLVRMAPVARRKEDEDDSSVTTTKTRATDITERIGNELRSIAVKVQAIRGSAVRAAESIISGLGSESSTTTKVVGPVSWILGEYASFLTHPEDTMNAILQALAKTPYPEVAAISMHALMKIFALVVGDERSQWTAERKAKISLLMTRLLHTLEPFPSHPNLEVQERAVQFTELLKLTAEAVSGQEASTDEVYQDPPLLLTQALPSLFTGWELNSVAFGAQNNVPLPEGLDLDQPINPNLERLLAEAHMLNLPVDEDDEFEIYYHQKPVATSISSSEPAIKRLADAPDEIPNSYQNAGEESYLDPDILARRKAERMDKNKDDPFYIHNTSSGISRTSTPIHNILKRENGSDLDIDSIPIMALDLSKVDDAAPQKPPAPLPRPKSRQRVVVAADETLAGSGRSTPGNYDSENTNSDGGRKTAAVKSKQHKRPKNSLLQVDSSHIGALSLHGRADEEAVSSVDPELQKREEAEMAAAMKEVERLRLEMQRANERIQVAQGVPAEGVAVVQKKKKKKKAVPDGEDGDVASSVAKPKKKKKKPPVALGGEGDTGAAAAEGEVVAKPKKKKKKPAAEGEGTAGDSGLI